MQTKRPTLTLGKAQSRMSRYQFGHSVLSRGHNHLGFRATFGTDAKCNEEKKWGFAMSKYFFIDMQTLDEPNLQC